MISKKFPVLTPCGRQRLTGPLTLLGAKAWVKKNIRQVKGFNPEIWERSELAKELNGGLDGWMYSFHMDYRS